MYFHVFKVSEVKRTINDSLKFAIMIRKTQVCNPEREAFSPVSIDGSFKTST